MKAVSLFSGCGGFCEGVELAGLEVAVAVEYDRYACMTYRHNFPKTPLFEGDIHDFLVKGAGHEAQYRLQDVDLVFGGPPCQGYSQIGPRDLFDDRNELYLQFARVVKTLQPRMLLMENVPNLLLMKKGHFRDKILKHLASLGYRNVTYVKVSAADYGVPQTRERVFFFGTRDDLHLPFALRDYAMALLAKMQVKTSVTVRQAIGDLPADIVHSGETMPYPAAAGGLSAFAKSMRLDTAGFPYSTAAKRRRGVGRSDKALLHNHHTKEMQEKRRHLISFLKPGCKANSLPVEIWNNARPEKWRRLHPDLPSHTILAQMHRDLSEWIHPSLERWITVREAARLQSFHDGFVFRGSEWQQLKQVGNAVPPLLGYAAARMIKSILEACDGRVEDPGVPLQRVLPDTPAVVVKRRSRDPVHA